MEMNTYDQKGVYIVEVKGRLMGGRDTGDLDEKLYSIIGKNIKKAVVDLKNCDWINSSGLAILIHHYKKFRDMGGELKLANLANKVKQLIIVSRLTQIFDARDSVDDAIDAFK